MQLDVVFGAGEAGTITATTAMWSRIAEALLLAMNPAANAPLSTQLGQQGLRKAPAPTQNPAHGPSCDMLGCDAVCERLTPITKPSGALL